MSGAELCNIAFGQTERNTRDGVTTVLTTCVEGNCPLKKWGIFNISAIGKSRNIGRALNKWEKNIYKIKQKCENKRNP